MDDKIGRKITLVAAMANRRVIGYQGDMPWHLPADLKRFKQLTIGKTVVMGRKTFYSIGRPLPNRTNIILSRHPLIIDGCEVFKDPNDIVTRHSDDLMIVGGAQIYQIFLPLATHMELTHIELNVEGDTFFPQWDQEQWEIAAKSERFTQLPNPETKTVEFSYKFCSYKKR